MPAYTWDPVYKGAGVTLSNADMRMYCTSNDGGRSIVGHSSGLYYAEFYYDSFVYPGGAIPGFISSLGLYNKFPGKDVEGWGWYLAGGALEHNNAETPAYFPATPIAGAVIGLKLNFTTLVAQFTYLGADIGAPITIVAGRTYHLANGGASSGSDDNKMTTRQTASALDDLPTDYLAWDGTGAPSAIFTRTPHSGEKFLTVQFTDTSLRTPTSWLWDFGDGTVSALQNPSHIYQSNGSYTVTLTATNDFGESSYTIEDCVVVTGTRTNPVFAYDNLLSDPDATVTVSSEDADFPMENAYDWNATTFWKPTASGDSWIRASFAEARLVNSIGLFAHDLGTNGGSFKLQYSTNGGSSWVDVTLPHAPESTECVYKRFIPILAADWRVLFTSTPASSIGVLYFGVDFELEHGDWTGNSSPKMARDTKVTNVTSERGTLLGRSLISQGSTFKVQPAFMSEAFVDDTWYPFVIHAEQKPFFYAWNIDERPSESAFCWTNAAIGAASYTSLDYLSTMISGQCRLK